MTVSKDMLDQLSPEKKALLALKLRQKRNAGQNPSAASPFPEVTHDEDRRYDPFLLTGLQHAYWVGRKVSFEIGKIPSRAFLELQVDNLNTDRLNQAWTKLIERHDMLRVIVHENGRQQVLREVPEFKIPIFELHGLNDLEIQERLDEIKESMLYDRVDSSIWPLFDVRVAHLEKSSHLFLCLDLLTFDAGSITIIFKEMVALYYEMNTTLPPLDITFRDYMEAMKVLQQSELYDRSQNYWTDRLSTIPAGPELPLAMNPASISKPRFIRNQAKLDAKEWAAAKEKAQGYDLTPTSLLLAVYAEILGAWSNNKHFCINIPMFNRLPLHPQVNDVLGDFTSVELLEVNQKIAANFLDRAKMIQDQVRNDLDHRYMDGVEVLRELARIDRDTFARGIPYVFTSLLEHGFAPTIEKLGPIVRSVNQTASVWMDIHLDEDSEGKLLVKWDAVEGLFPPGMVEDMVAAYVKLLSDLANNEESWNSTYKDLLPKQQKDLRSQINDTVEPLTDGLLHTLFGEQAQKAPDNAALITSSRTLSYGELFGIANQIGRKLRDLGAKPNQLIAISMDKGWEQVAAVYGIMTAGSAYVPIDPEFPTERIHHLIERSDVTIVLTQEKLRKSINWPSTVTVLSVDDVSNWSAFENNYLEPAQSSDDLAYVLYTSGSTGLPKGVMLHHKGSVNRWIDVNRRFNINESDRAIGLTALQHDLSIFDMFSVLLAGGTLVMPDVEFRRDPAHWLDMLETHQVTLWNSVPAFMEMFVEFLDFHTKSNDINLDSMRLAMHSGDWVPVNLPDRIRGHMKNCHVISLGGPTETTTWDIFYPVGTIEPDWKSIPYGRPMTNASYYILNENLEPCPNWVTGEMYIGGVGLAKGYWQDQEKTDAKFVSHPVTGERIYRSGDLGRFIPDGNIEFMGRADFQVKIRGMRIELGEIESNLMDHDDIRTAIAVAISDKGRNNKGKLVAYVVPEDGKKLAPEKLADYLFGKIPDYMIPGAFVVLDKLPLTRNGKVDRRNLPEPDESNLSVGGAQAARGGGSLDRVAKLVSDVLEIETPSADADMLNLGANSIDMVRIGNQIEAEFGFRPGMDQIFRHRTISALAGYVDSQVGGGAEDSSSSIVMDQEISDIINSFEMLLTPEDKDAFKKTLPGVRRDLESNRSIALEMPNIDDDFLDMYRERRSRRQFSLKPISFKHFSQWLSKLAIVKLDGEAKWLYGSAGGQYPIQVYLHVKPGRVEGLEGGSYYVDPLNHRLILLDEEASVTGNIHVPFVNTPTFAESAFSVFLVSDLAAIAPSYGDLSLKFSTIEAGVLAHHLELAAINCDIGLCQIGSVDFDQIREHFNLGYSHVLIHSMLGGRRLEDDDRQSTTYNASATNGTVDKATRAIDRIKQLSPDELKAFLAANKDGKE